MTIQDRKLGQSDVMPMNSDRGVVSPEALPAGALKRAFSLFPSGVVIATTLDGDGRPHGFTASTFVPLSLDPPMVLMCLNRSAQCFDAFMSGEKFAVSVLRPDHEDIAVRFSTRGADKFVNTTLDYWPSGLPIIRGALASFECRSDGRHPGGDHIILTGTVERLRFEDEGAAMVHFVRSFRELEI